MTIAAATPDPLDAWHAYMRAPDRAALEMLIADACVFRSPAVHSPQIGKAVTVEYLTAAASVLGDDTFRYVGEWQGEDSAVLEFACEIAGGIQVNGVDVLRWNADGRIVEFKVMIRPLKALTAVVPLMAAALA